MADRYWVGGAGTWNSTNTASWSTTSGGAGGASVPTASDNVFFDANSGLGGVTYVSNVSCLNFDCTGYTSTISASATLQVYGTTFKLSAGTIISGSFIVAFYRTSAGTIDITTAGKTLGNVTLGLGGTSSSVTYSLQDALTCGALTVASGTFTTNNFAVTATSLGTSGNISVINLGSSTVTLSGSNNVVNFSSTPANLTFNSGTSSILCNYTGAAGMTFQGGDKTFYNVSFSGAQSTAAPTLSVTGVNTYNSLSFTAPSVAGTRTVTFSANQTINGSLTTSGTSSTQRVQFGSSAAGTQRTLSAATIGTLTNTNWKDIALTGAGSPWSAPLSVWDLGNNSGITFNNGPLYWVGGAGTWNTTSATNWALTSGGSGGAGIPGPNTNVVFDTNSGTGQVAYSSSGVAPSYCQDLTVTATQALVLGSSSVNGYVYIYGSVSLPAGGSFSFVSAFQQYYFKATTTGKTITTNGKTWAYSSTYFDSTSGGWTIQDNFTAASSGTITHNNGNLTLNNITFTADGLTTGNGTVSFGSSTLNLTKDCLISVNTTLNAGTSSIVGASYRFQGGGKTFYNVSIYLYGDYTFQPSTMTGANTFNNLTFSIPSASYLQPILISNNQTVNGTFSVTGNSLTRRAMIQSDTIGTQRTITVATGGTFTNANFRDIAIAGAAAPISGTSIGDCQNNSGITFTAPKTVYWNLAGTQTFASTGWATTSGGTPNAANFPLPQDTAVFNNAGAVGTVSINPNLYYSDVPGIDCSARTSAMTLNIENSAYPTIYGNVTLSSSVSMTYGGNSYCYFYTAGTQTLTTNGVTFNIDRQLVSQTSSSGVFYLGSALTMPNTAITYFVINGNFNSNNYNITVPAIQMGPGTKTFGSSTVNITYNNSSICTISGYTLAAPVNFNFTYAGATGTRSINAAAQATGSDAVGLVFASGTDTITLSGAGVGNLNFTGFSGTLSNSTRSILGNLTISTGMTLTAGTNITTFAATSGTKTITTNGKTLDFPLTFNGVGGTWQLQDSLTVGATRAITLSGGTLNTNNQTVTSGTFVLAGALVKTLTLGSTVWSVASTGTVWDCAFTANTTFNAGTSEIVLSSTSTTGRTFAGGGLTYNKVTIGGATGTSTTTISGSNTFATLASTKVVAHTISITSGTTQTIGTWSINGTAGNVVTLGSTSTTNHILIKSGGGTVTADYMSISRSTGSPSLTWLATNSTNGGNNSGWYFGSFPKGNTLLFGSNF